MTIVQPPAQPKPGPAWPRLGAWLARRGDVLLCAGLGLLALSVYAATLLPGLGAGDTAELQRVGPTLGLAHPTGYPLYTLLGWGWSQLPLGGSPAWRMNLFSAVAAAGGCAALYLVCRELGQRRLVAAAAALALALSYALWSQATRAEVWGLQVLLQALLLLALLRWRRQALPLWVAGLVAGLGLAHHRSIALLAPGALAFVLATRPPRLAELGRALLACAVGCLIYLYIPLRAPAWLDPWQVLWERASGDIAGLWLDPARLGREGWSRLAELGREFILPQFLLPGALLALLGAARLLARQRAVAALLLGGYLLLLAFCAAYYVSDVEVFLIPAHLIQAVLLGEGLMLLLAPLPERLAAPAAALALLLPWALLRPNLERIGRANQSAAEPIARAVLAQDLPAHALLIGDWEQTETLHYLQEVEGLRPDLRLAVRLPLEQERALIEQELARSSAVYLLAPRPELQLAQWPRQGLWQVSVQPPTISIERAADFAWADGIALRGYSLSAGPYLPGAIVPLALEWQARAQPRGRYTLFVHLVGPDARIWGQHDREPAGAPTSQWRPGERYVDLYGPVVHPQAPPGRYHLVLGWYEYPSLERLGRVDQSGQSLNAEELILGEVDIRPLGQE